MGTHSALPADAEDLVDDFDLFDGWEDRYAYLIDLGRKLEPLSDEERTDANKVQGCMSQVWFVRDPSNGDGLQWRGDSDAVIVRGLIAVLQVLYRGQPLETAGSVDVHEVFRRIGLEGHLSMNRRNGFFAMVTRLVAFADAGSA